MVPIKNLNALNIKQNNYENILVFLPITVNPFYYACNNIAIVDL